MAEQFPRQFGKYVLLKSLARGGMGEIYLAASGQPGGLNKLCVIKKVITGKADRTKVNRFLDEAKVVLRLSHGNLVSTFDAGDVGGELFIAMELVEGKDLREIWNRCVRTRTRIPVDVALVVVRDVARALAYVHSYAGLRLVHRDVAPPNILLSYFGEVKLTDFGLARSVLKQEHTAPGVVFGRASYLAPEQARGEVADARTDVYSLGIVLWELLTGQPYLQLAGLDPVTSLSMVRNPKPQPPSSRAPWIGAELDAVVLKALAPDRTTRFQSAEELRRSLSEVMTRVAPRADAERVTEFLRGLYRDIITEESAERERLLAETVPLFRGERLPEGRTPRTDVFPPRHLDFDGHTLGLPGTPDAAEPRAVSLAGAGSPPVGAAAAAVRRLTDAPKESLHVSALRARAGSQQRRAGADIASADAPTKVWRKTRGVRGEDAAQTFVGRVVDNRYRIHHRIGEGGMGTVYAAEHVEIGKSVAVKILHRIFSGEEQLVERFRREARAASRVGHPHIIEVTDFGTTEEGCAYFVMELLEGMDLADVLVREGRLDAQRAVRIGVQICQALEAAHTTGIIHRDLKPENIFLVARDGQADFVKVLDFGIARNLSGESRRLTNPGMAMGTPEYMAPEQSQGRPADRRTDVYAVGALLHEMVIGAAPFQAESAQRMLEAKRRPLESLRGQVPELPAALDAAILRALSPDPERRPQTMAQLEYELAKIAWGRPQAVANLLGLKEGAAESAAGQRPAETSELPQVSAGRVVGDREQDQERDEQPPQRKEEDSAQAARTASPVDLAATTADLDRETPPLPLVDLDRETPPPPLVVPARSSTARAADELERLLEADLTPPPQARSRPQPALAASASARTAAAPNVAVQTATARSSPVAASGVVSQRADPLPELTLGIDPEPAPVLRLSRGNGVARTMATLSLLVALGGASTWAATHGGAGTARQWGRWLRDRVAAVQGSVVLPGAASAGAAAAGQAARGGDSRTSGERGRAGTATSATTLTSAPIRPTITPLGRSTRAAVAAADSSPSSPVLEQIPSTTAGTTPTIASTIATGAVSAGSLNGTRPRPPEIVQTPPIDRARSALAAGLPDDAIAVLRPVAGRGNLTATPLLADALVASGWNDVKAYRWNLASRKAREAIALAAPAGASHGGHALLGEAAYALGDFNAALAEFTKALAEAPGDARLKRRVIRSRRQLLHRTGSPGDGSERADSLTSEAAAE